MPRDTTNILSPLQFERFVLEELVVETNHEYLFELSREPGYATSIDFDLWKREDAPSFRIRLFIDLSAQDGDTTCSYRRLRVVVLGFFSFDEETPEKLVRESTPLNQLMMLYGVARGIISGVTGLGHCGAIMLPSVDFHEIARSKISDAAAEAETVPKRRRRPNAKRASRSPA